MALVGGDSIRGRPEPSRLVGVPNVGLRRQTGLANRVSASRRA
jgi:hypothetical protein